MNVDLHVHLHIHVDVDDDDQVDEKATARIPRDNRSVAWKPLPCYSRPMLAPDYLWNYRCNLKGCCCKGWRIGFREGDYHRVMKRLAGTPLLEKAQRALKPRTTPVLPAIATPSVSVRRFADEFVEVAFDERGGCPFVTDDGGCELHATAGFGALPVLCANFPVVGLRTPEGVECYFEFICPAVLACLPEATTPARVVDSPPEFTRPVFYFEYDTPISEVRLTSERTIRFEDFAAFRRDALDLLADNARTPLRAFARIAWFVHGWALTGSTRGTLNDFSIDDGAYLTFVAHLAARVRESSAARDKLGDRAWHSRQFATWHTWGMTRTLDVLARADVPDAAAAARSIAAAGPDAHLVLANFLIAKVHAAPLQNENTLQAAYASLAEVVGYGLHLAGAFGAASGGPPDREQMATALATAEHFFRARRTAPPGFDALRRLGCIVPASPPGTMADLVPVLDWLAEDRRVPTPFPTADAAFDAMTKVLKARLDVAFRAFCKPVADAIRSPRDALLEGPWDDEPTAPEVRALVGDVRRDERHLFDRLALSDPSIPVAALLQRLRLEPVEVAICLALLLARTDTGWARAFAHVAIDYESGRPSARDLALLFGDTAIRAALAPGGRLRSLGLAVACPADPRKPGFGSARFELDPHIATLLLGGDPDMPVPLVPLQADPDRSATLLPPPAAVVDPVARAEATDEAGNEPRCVLLLGSEGHDPASIVSTATGRNVRAIRLRKEDEAVAADAVRLLLRDAVLRDGAGLVLLDEGAATAPAIGSAISAAAQRIRTRVFVASLKRPAGLFGTVPVREFAIPAPTRGYLGTIVARAAPRDTVIGDVEGIRKALRNLAIPPGRLVAAVHAAGTDAQLQVLTPGSRRLLSSGRLVAAMRAQMQSRIGEFADTVSVGHGWEDLQLPDDSKTRLGELVSGWKNREKVLEEWGFGNRIAHSRGMSALLWGPPGTGKTMAAGIVARELGLEVFRVDLSRIVDKYIGETEKHLARVFDEAERGQVLLLFDEADSLFGKRTAVQSSTDRYANLEVNYLLQRMESHEGVVVLTTNNEQNIDEAFKRRLRYRIHFPMPSAVERTSIWRNLVPPEALVDGDLDFAGLAESYEMSGGHIRNAVLRAAYLAADVGSGLSSALLRRAADIEYRELGKLVREEREFRWRG